MGLKTEAFQGCKRLKFKTLFYWALKNPKLDNLPKI